MQKPTYIMTADTDKIFNIFAPAIRFEFKDLEIECEELNGATWVVTYSKVNATTQNNLKYFIKGMRSV